MSQMKVTFEYYVFENVLDFYKKKDLKNLKFVEIRLKITNIKTKRRHKHNVILLPNGILF